MIAADTSDHDARVGDYRVRRDRSPENKPMLITMSEFKFSAKSKICKDNAVELLQNFDKSEGTPNSSLDDSLLNGGGCSGQQLFLDCDICGERFASKKPLRVHINTHLRKLRIVLKRVVNPKVVKVKKDTYWLDPEKTGLLKLTLKKQSAAKSPNDSLKLTLKKSSESEDFTVVNNNFYPVIKCSQERDVAGAKENDPKSDKAQENSIDEPFENVMVDQQDDYDNGKLDTDHHNPLEENERPSADINESDSDVGSDMANPSEKDDQNADDTQSADKFDNSEKRLSESEDHEETDALEATCRETIENLKKLGEQSSSRSASQLIDSSSVEEEDDRSPESNMIHNLEQNPAISINPKSFTFSNHTTERTSICDNEDKNRESTEASHTQGFNWNQLSDLSSKSNEDFNKEDSEQQGDACGDANMDNAGSILQSFLIDHQRRNSNEVSLSNNMASSETAEYVPLEKLAETINTCRVCNEKFKDIAHLEEHRSKAGHYQCNIPECANLFHSTMEMSIHRAQVHNTPLSPSVSQLSPHHLPSSTNTSHLSQATHSPHTVSAASMPETTNGSHQLSRTSPLTSPHQTNSPTFNAAVAAGAAGQQMQIPPVNFEQLPPPVQQLAQQVQRMPLPQAQMPPSLPPGANTMIPGSNYFVQPPGRPPLYRVPGPQGIHYPPHMAHLYQYGPGPYPQMGAPPPQMHPQMQPQQIPRGRYPSASVVQNSRAPRLPQTGPVPRQRMKRPLQQPVQQQNNTPSAKQRRMDVLLPDRNEDADCHVIAQQKRNDGLPVIQNVQGATTQQTTSRNDSTIHLTDSITLSVRQPAQVQNTSNPGGKKSDAKAVANVLAARGITVTPAANKNKTSEQNKQQIPPQQQQRPSPSQQPLNVTALNLNSAISIIPTSSQRKQQEQGQFAVPQNKQNKSPINDQVERPPRPPTVDLTQDTPPQMPVVRRGRPPRALLTCQVCDKNFQNQDMLTQHMATHRTTSKLLHRCNLCPAQYPTVQALTTHKQTYHKEVDAVAQNGGTELALPVVDLKSPHVLNRLANLGIHSYIPLSQLSAQTGGYFGLPIITIDGARNTSICNLGALGATSILSLGPLKHISNG
ncbi:histone acetyltransferase KAT6A isoform X2 [Monomorium pharaonis]|uniref:histone acetyltransferase KAT6A isoform X2 n=1 Tax=Monomorium pharaonis TaxID=307658 RepID=UPI0017464D28|nr:histone acetyltransferase KAT6A isoform X2 [Monomorium pharaonis]